MTIEKRFYELDPKGHVWQTHENGTLDIFAYNPVDPHNGPRCVNCGLEFCHHCKDSLETTCPKANSHP